MPSRCAPPFPSENFFCSTPKLPYSPSLSIIAIPPAPLLCPPSSFIRVRLLIPLVFLLLLLSRIVFGLHRQVHVPGNIIIGGLFPVHEGSRNASGSSLCGRIKADQGVQRMVSMLYALEQINRTPRILPGLMLGAQILDTCSVETHALEQSLQFIKSICAEEDLLRHDESAERFRLWPVELAHRKKQKIAAVIGAASSQVSVMVASMLQLFKIPMVSYSSTGVELSEKPRFAYFSRVAPPDNLQAKAMAHLIAKLGWNYVHAIVDTGSYGERGMDSFRAGATELNICIDGDVHKISRRWTDDQFEELLLRMHASKARGVVMFVDEDNLRRFLANLMRLATEQPELRNYFWFVASDSWGMKGSVVKGFERLVNGAITVAPKVRYLKGFTEYFASLGPSNTFLSEYWQSMNCSERFHPNFGSCFRAKGYVFKQEAYVPFVYDAVQLVARALHTYIQEECGLHTQWHQCSLAETGFEGKRLQQLYRNVSLIADQPPLIDANGDGNGQYSIFQLDGRGVYRRVGGWMDNALVDFDLVDIRAGLQRADGRQDVVPLSVCSLPCASAHYRAYQDQSCCWTCIPCDTTTSIIPNETSCVQCPLGNVPNPALNACQPIKPVHLEWHSPWALVPAIFSLIGLMATAAVSVIFFIYNYTPVVMASGRELCYCMLTGIALCYSVTFVLISPPSELICTLTQILLGLSMALMYAAILVKTNRLARVFKPNSALRPRWIGPTAQVFFCCALASVQLAVALVWLWIEPPGTAIQYPSRTDAVLTCKATISHLLISLSYCGLLIIACTIYAFKTRKIPENFNETRLIGFTMYSTSILWLAFAPIYFATQNNFRIQLTSLCMATSFSATVALVCFFGPKIYICLFQPDKNVRTRSSAVGKLVNQQMRFISQITTNPPPLNAADHLGCYQMGIASHCTMSSTVGMVSEPSSSGTSPYRSGISHTAARRRSSVGTCFIGRSANAEEKTEQRRYLRRMETIASSSGHTEVAQKAQKVAEGRRRSSDHHQQQQQPPQQHRTRHHSYAVNAINANDDNTAVANGRRQSNGNNINRRRRSSSSILSALGEGTNEKQHGSQQHGLMEEKHTRMNNANNNSVPTMPIATSAAEGGTQQQIAQQHNNNNHNNPMRLILREINDKSQATFL